MDTEENRLWPHAVCLTLALAWLPVLALGLPEAAGSADADGCVIERVDAPKLFSDRTSRNLPLDAHSHLQISYHDGGANDDFKYAYQDASGWHIETVDSEGGIGFAEGAKSCL